MQGGFGARLHETGGGDGGDVDCRRAVMDRRRTARNLVCD